MCEEGCIECGQRSPIELHLVQREHSESRYTKSDGCAEITVLKCPTALEHGTGPWPGVLVRALWPRSSQREATAATVGCLSAVELSKKCVCFPLWCNAHVIPISAGFGAAPLAEIARPDRISTAVQNDTELVQVYSADCCIVECARACSHTQTIHQTIWSPLAELHTFRDVWRACQLPLEGYLLRRCFCRDLDSSLLYPRLAVV